MEQVHEDRALEQAEEWEEVEEDGEGKRALVRALEATASAPSAGKERPTKWARLAMTRDVPNAAPR